MPLRRPRDTGAAKEVAQRLSKLEARMYVLWILGISIGAVQLKPTTFSVLGASFVVARPELIEGMLFLGCFAYLVVMFHVGVGSPYRSDQTPRLRDAIFFSARSFGNTLRGLSKLQRLRIKLRARGFYNTGFWVRVIATFLPVVHILMFRRAALVDAVSVIFAR